MTKRTLKRRKLDKQATLRAFEIRMMALDMGIFEQLEDKWISSFDVFDTSPHCEMEAEIESRYGTELDKPLYRLYRVCLERGITPRGVTSERVRAGMRMAALPNEELPYVMYCGRHSGFRHKKRNVFALAPCDKRYLENQKKDQFGRLRKKDLFVESTLSSSKEHEA